MSRLNAKYTKHCMQVQLGILQFSIPYLGHYDLLFTFRSTSEENLVWVMY